MAEPILSKTTASALLHSDGLNPFDEERFHPWRPNITTGPHNPFCDYAPQTTFTQPFLRRWDHYSGSHPDEQGRMQARDSRRRLHTRAVRVETLTWHANYQNWEHDTPFVSFASSQSRLTDFMNSRNWKVESTLTVVNPNVRIARRLPMINMGAEMRHYNVLDPYDRDYAYYDDEYLHLWEVTPEEIVGHWDWDELSQNPEWYEEVVLPAFRRHDEEFLEGMAVQDGFDMTSMQDALPGKFSTYVPGLFYDTDLLGPDGDDDGDDHDHDHDHDHDSHDGHDGHDGHDADQNTSIGDLGHTDSDSDSVSRPDSSSDSGSDKATDDEAETSKDEDAKTSEA
jgi:hypothetical protein